MSIQLLQRDDHENNSMNIKELVVNQSPARKDRSVSHPAIPGSRGVRDAPKIDLGNRTSFPTRFSRDDRTPSPHYRSKNRRKSSSRSHKRDNNHYSDKHTDDYINTKPVELDLLANPKKRKKDEIGRMEIEEEDFSDHSYENAKDAFVRDEERFDFEKKRDNGSRNYSEDRRRTYSEDRRRSERRTRRQTSRRKSSRIYEPYNRQTTDTQYYKKRSSWGDKGQSYSMSYEEEQQRRQRVFERFDKLIRRGVKIAPRFLSQDAQLYEQELEADRLEKHFEVDESIRFQRNALTTFTTGLEMLNDKYNPIGLYTTGLSESIMENIESYDPVFEELYEKYRTQVSMSPEFKLVFMLGSGIFMHHISHTMFGSNMARGSMMQDFQRSSMGLAGDFAGVRNPRAGFMDKNVFGSDNNNQTYTRQQPQPPLRREMQGPNTNTNDLLNSFMDQNPQNINDKILHEIDDILDNPSEDDDETKGITLDS